MEEGKVKVCHYWESEALEDHISWMIQVRREGLITEDDIESLKAELQERCILPKAGLNIL